MKITMKIKSLVLLICILGLAHTQDQSASIEIDPARQNNCISNCDSCLLDTLGCDNCSTGYSIYFDTVNNFCCKESSVRCNSCSSFTGECEICNQGYTLQNGRCEDSSSAGALSIVGFIVQCLCCILCCYLCFYCYKKNSQNRRRF